MLTAGRTHFARTNILFSCVGLAALSMKAGMATSALHLQTDLTFITFSLQLVQLMDLALSFLVGPWSVQMEQIGFSSSLVGLAMIEGS